MQKLIPLPNRAKYSEHGGLTSTEIRAIFRYEYPTGDLIRKHTGRKVRSDLVKIRNVKVSVNHVIWILHTGVWPMGLVKHIDGDRKNCRIENLKEIVSRRRKPVIQPRFSEIGYAEQHEKPEQPEQPVVDPNGGLNGGPAIGSIDINFVFDATQSDFLELELNAVPPDALPPAASPPVSVVDLFPDWID